MAYDQAVRPTREPFSCRSGAGQVAKAEVSWIGRNSVLMVLFKLQPLITSLITSTTDSAFAAAKNQG